MIRKYPTLEQILAADQEQLCRWHRFLRFAETEEEQKLATIMHERYVAGGKFTPELSRKIGWDEYPS